MTGFNSSADERAPNWMLRWTELGGDLDLVNGSLSMIVDPIRCSIEHSDELGAMVEEVQGSPRLAQALGRAVLDLRRFKAMRQRDTSGARA